MPPIIRRVEFRKPDRKTYVKNYNKTIYQTRKAKGICVECGKVPAVKPSVRCEECKKCAAERSAKSYSNRKGN